MSAVIRAVQIRLLAIPLPAPFKLGFGVLHDLPRVLLTLEVDQNGKTFIAVGEAAIDFPFSAYDAWDMIWALRQLNLIGREVEDHQQILNESLEAREVDGIFAVQAALNMVLDDALGQAYHVGVSRL